MDDFVAELHLPIQERIQLAISRLPVLTKADIPAEDSCPVCLNPFDTILEEQDGNSTPEEEDTAGVTKLTGCGHIFCKACLVEWIKGRHGSCPSCRNVFSSIKPPSDSDNESSDGDYVPGDDEEDEEEDYGFFDSDDFMETDSVFDDMDVEENLHYVGMEDDNVSVWEEQAGNASMEYLGLSSDDDVSEEVSEVEILGFSEVRFDNLPADDAAVYSDDGESSGVLRAPEDEATEPK